MRACVCVWHYIPLSQHRELPPSGHESPEDVRDTRVARGQRRPPRRRRYGNACCRDSETWLEITPERSRVSPHAFAPARLWPRDSSSTPSSRVLRESRGISSRAFVETLIARSREISLRCPSRLLSRRMRNAFANEIRVTPFEEMTRRGDQTDSARRKRNDSTFRLRNEVKT